MSSRAPAQGHNSEVACANRLISKLEKFASIPANDREALEEACKNVRSVPAKRDIISEGDKPQHVHLMVEGWAARYKIVRNGSRQITAFLVPGDFCDLHVTILGEMDHGILALTPAKVAYIRHEDMDALSKRPELTRALWWTTLVDEAVLRAWIVNIGRRDAFEAIAHLFCELHQRLKNIGLVEDGCFKLPITQETLADALGLTSVHVNRTLKRLYEEGLIDLEGGELTILDPKALGKAAGFDRNYLHGRDQVG